MNGRGKVKYLPLLPGFNINNNIEQTNFHKSQHFDKIHDGIYYLADKPKFADLQHPPIYATDDKQVVATWIAFDKQKLVFKAYFEEDVGDKYWKSIRRRMVNISFFLEDGTMKISEPITSNSGMEQGVLVKRQKIPIPDQIGQRFYGVDDLNIGNEPIIFGRAYKIFDCDKFTRNFLTRLGILVPDTIVFPSDSREDQFKEDLNLKKSRRKENSLSKFLKYDGQVLRFYGYWDDTENIYGLVHNLEIYYYLADDMVEIKETVPEKLVKNYGMMYIRKTRIPKLFTGLNPIGSNEPFTVLNIMQNMNPRAKNYFVLDPLNTGEVKTDYYTEIDFFIGAQINVYGRKIIITDLDPFTKDYYRKKYGIEEFVPISRPNETEKKHIYSERYIPPYNGIGSYEDSLGNCFSIIPRRPKLNWIKFYRLSDHVLRFRAKMISKDPENEKRQFIIRFYIMDDTISIFELSNKKSGFHRHLFQKRMKLRLPGTEIYSNAFHHYEKSHFYVGAKLNLNGFNFELISADLYALRYMENNPSEFPKANAKLIMRNLKEALKSVYKEFLQEYSPDIRATNPVLDCDKLRHALNKYLGDKITEHEIITIARKYSSQEKKEFCTREYVRALVHYELNGSLWNNLDRLEGNIMHFDRNRTGFLNRKELYTILKGSQIPLNLELLNSVLDHISQNEEGKLDCRDLLKFLNVKIDPVMPVIPVDMRTALWWASEKEPDCGAGIDWRAFLNDLELEDEEGSEKKCLSKTE